MRIAIELLGLFSIVRLHWALDLIRNMVQAFIVSVLQKDVRVFLYALVDGSLSYKELIYLIRMIVISGYIHAIHKIYS